MKKLWIMNIKDVRELNEKSTDITKFAFCLKNGIAGIGWGNEIDLPDDQKSEAHLKALNALRGVESGDYLWIAEEGKYYIAVAKGPITTAPTEYHKYDIAYYIACDYYEIGDEFPKELDEFKSILTAYATIQEKAYDELLYHKIDEVFSNIKAQNNIDRNRTSSFFASKRNRMITLTAVLLLFTLIITFSVIRENKIETKKQEIKEDLSGMVFSSVNDAELSVISVNNSGEYTEEKFKLSDDKKAITDRIEDKHWLKLDVYFANKKYNTSIGMPIYQENKIVGLDADTDYAVITSAHQKMTESFLEREKTKTTLYEFMPNTKAYLEELIEKGYISGSENASGLYEFDITLKKEGTKRVSTMRLFLDYPTKQTNRSDAKVKGVELSVIGYSLPIECLNPYLDKLPGSLVNENDLVSFIKKNGSTTTTDKDDTIVYNSFGYSIESTYKSNGISYTYYELYHPKYNNATVPIEKKLTVEVEKAHKIYLADYPEFSTDTVSK